MIIAENKHKLLSTGSVESEPTKKASAFVTEVIVIDGPAWIIPSRNLSSADKCCGVWSIVLTMTNISSTPIPSTMNGRMLWNEETFRPSANAIP